ncbi:MAG: UDP-N-acetylmuramate--L-alanine ligase [Clostridia bacterium]
METIDLSRIKKIHFIGIGGASMSGLAHFMLDHGVSVSGTDSVLTESTDFLVSAGANIYSPHDGSLITLHNPDLVVYTNAVPADNPELRVAQARGIPILERAVFLGLYMKEFAKGIAVAGTHGKTTTTSMISSILFENNLDPSIHIGGSLPLIGGNTKIGGSEFFVTEACEYHDSFLQLRPWIAVVLNVEYDHVDYFKTFAKFKQSFADFVGLVPTNGFVVVCADDPDALAVANHATCPVLTYGVENKKANWQAHQITYTADGNPCFDLVHDGAMICRITLGTVGIHNVLNSLAAIAVATACGLSPQDCVAPLLHFTGANRRFEYKGMMGAVKIVDDYAHHPTEIRTTLTAARASLTGKKSAGRLIVAFQPHTYTRTRELMADFANAFQEADLVVLADIYASRETNPGDVHSTMLADAINQVSGNCVYQESFEAIAAWIRQEAKPGDLVITMGAGDIFKVADLLLKG